MTKSLATRWLLVLPMALLSACGSHKSSPSNTKTLTVAGTVTTEAGAGIAGVAVTLPAYNASATTDASGTFSLAANSAAVGTNVAILLAHPDYSRLTSTFAFAEGTTSQNYMLRKHDVVQTVTLPSAGGPAVTVGTTRDDGGSILSIGAGALAMPDGTAAAGDVNVKFTYWHPQQSLQSAPAPLAGTLDSDASIQGLFSYGMANIEINQNGTDLKVADGQTLGLAFTQPASLNAELVGIDPNRADAPMLWYADESTGVWVNAGSLADGALTADPNNKLITARLPHLSAWNVDGITTTNLCVTAKVMGKCGNVMANADFSLWVSSGGELLKNAVHTGSDGTFCANLIGSSDARDSAHKADFYAWLSAVDEPSVTACNPTGKTTLQSLCGSNKGAVCTGRDQFAQTQNNGQKSIDLSAKLASCQIPLVSADLCHYCPGTYGSTASGQCRVSTPTGFPSIGPMVAGGCTQLPTITVPWCDPANPPLSCDNPKAPKVGQPCNVDIDCCPTGSLVCGDGLCVPSTDN